MLSKTYFLNTKLNPGAYIQLPKLRNAGFRKVKRKPGLVLNSDFAKSMERFTVVTEYIITTNGMEKIHYLQVQSIWTQIANFCLSVRI